MRLFIKQKVFSWRDSFTVKNESGQTLYTAKSELISFGHKLHVYDAGGREVAYIRQQLLTFMPKYEIYIGAAPPIRLRKHLTLFRPSYELEGTGITLTGDFFAHEYSMLENDYQLMRVYKEWFTWGDSYVLDIVDEYRALLCLCTMLAVDCVMCERHDHHH